MNFKTNHTFDAHIDRVWAMFGDQDFHLAKAKAAGHRDIEVLEYERDPDNFSIKLSRVVDIELPGFARKFFKPTNTITSTEAWSDNGDGTYGGEWEMGSKGTPMSVTGTTNLVAEGVDKTRYELTFTLNVNIPLIGSKIADWAKSDSLSEVERDFAAGDAWLDDHPPSSISA